MSVKKCNNCEEDFKIDPEDQSFYERMKVPEPTLCPACRMQRRLAARNDRFLYRTNSSLSGISMITMYDPQNGLVVYDNKEWWSDNWDPLQYGKKFDFSRPFFCQFRELQQVVPRFNLFNNASENSEYVNYVTYSKNCYLMYGSWFNEDCMYCQTMNECKNSMDCLFLDKSELCYENVDCGNNFRAFFCQNCHNISDCYFCFDCKNCRNCIGCYNLRNKEYQILNKPVSKEEFEETKNKFSSYDELSHAKEFFLNASRKGAIHRDVIAENNQNSTGDLLFNCKNVKQCFSTYRSEDTAYSARCFDQKDSYDFEAGGKGELLYENMSNDFSFNSISCTTCEYMINSHYSDMCFHCDDCIGCVSLRHKRFCILNKQYTEEEYRELSSKVIEHMRNTKEWGEFFPIQKSLFGYNETLAQEYYPMTREEAVKKGYRWKEEEQVNISEQIYKLPDNINEVEDEILNKVLACDTCGKNFRIIENELRFYRKEGLAIPRMCPNCRHHLRFSMRPPRRLWERKCSKCKKDITTSYSPDKKFKIYCEDCYLKEVY